MSYSYTTINVLQNSWAMIDLVFFIFVILSASISDKILLIILRNVIWTTNIYHKLFTMTSNTISMPYPMLYLPQWYLYLSTVPVDGIALWGDKASTGMMRTKFGSYIEAHFTKKCLLIVEIWWEVCLAVIPLFAIRSHQHIMSQLSCQVQNFVAIAMLESEWG